MRDGRKMRVGQWDDRRESGEDLNVGQQYMGSFDISAVTQKGCWIGCSGRVETVREVIGGVSGEHCC